MFNKKLILVLVLVISVVNADGGLDIKIVHDGKNDQIRKLVYGNLFPGSFYISGTNIVKNDTKKSFDTCAFYFNSGGLGIFGFPLSYYYAVSDTDVQPGNITNKSTVAAFAPAAIIEYEETNGVDGYQLNEDSLLGWIRLDQYPSFDIEYNITVVNVTNAQGEIVQTKVFNVEATSQNGLFQMKFIVPGAHVKVGEFDLLSESSKFDIIIKGYYNDSINKASLLCSTDRNKFSCQSTGPSSNPNSRLALASFLMTTNVNVNANIHALNFKVKGDNDVNIDFNWVNHVQTSKGNVTLFSNSTLSSNGKELASGKFGAKYKGQLLIHSFNETRPNSIEWDPSLSASTDTPQPSSSSSILYSPLLILLLLLFIFNL